MMLRLQADYVASLSCCLAAIVHDAAARCLPAVLCRATLRRLIRTKQKHPGDVTIVCGQFCSAYFYNTKQCVCVCVQTCKQNVVNVSSKDATEHLDGL